MDTLEQLIMLVDYVSDGKKRVSELKELDKARKEAGTAVAKLAKAHGGVKLLMDAERTLRKAETAASDILSKANVDGHTIVSDAMRNAGDMKAERKSLTEGTEALRKKVAAAASALEVREATVKTREDKVSKRENDIVRQRKDVQDDILALRDKAQRVEHAMRN